MSNQSKIFRKVPVEVQNRSGFDESFEHILTQTVGTLVPLCCVECVPSQRISLGVFGQVALPPMATDFYGRVDYCLEAFWVPGRLLYGGFEDVFTHEEGGNAPAGFSIGPSFMPGAKVSYTATTFKALMGAGSLADYLGFKVGYNNSNPDITIPNFLPWVGYHRIYDEFYRDSRIQTPVFYKRTTGSISPNAGNYISQLPWVTGSTTAAQPIISASGFTLIDGTNALALRQRNYGKDRFTNATFEPQQGNPATLQFAVSGTSGSFTIGSFLAAYGLDQWKRKMNISGRYGDQQFADWGCYPESYFCDRPVFLGSHRFGIYNKSVYQTSQDVGATTVTPFLGVGSKYGSPVGVSDGSLVKDFTTSERGYLYVIGSVVPHAVYSTGVDPMFMRYRVGDFANPNFQILGDEPIYGYELSESAADLSTPSVFGYTQRFSAYKYQNDKVSGLVRDGESLSAFALKRSFASAPTLSTSFLQIPVTALDEVAASTSALPSAFGAWSDFFFKFHTSMPLSAYTIPTLGQKKDTHTKMVESGGVRL